MIVNHSNGKERTTNNTNHTKKEEKSDLERSQRRASLCRTDYGRFPSYSCRFVPFVVCSVYRNRSRDGRRM